MYVCLYVCMYIYIYIYVYGEDTDGFGIRLGARGNQTCDSIIPKVMFTHMDERQIHLRM